MEPINKTETHFLFDESKIQVSEDIVPILTFLQGIETEVDSFMGFEKRLRDIRKQYLETIKLVEHLGKLLRENSIEFQFKLSEHPETIIKKLMMDVPVRSKCIVLFANLEVLFCLNLAYENNTHDDVEIRRLAMNSKIAESFIDNFCLNIENPWFIKNQERLKGVTKTHLRRLRNSLTHFFSIDKGIQIADEMLDEKSRKLEKILQLESIFLSPKDIYEMIKGVALLMMRHWNKDCILSFQNKSLLFAGSKV